jgi:hypothetical protein
MKKSSIVALSLSVVPGLGHIYARGLAGGLFRGSIFFFLVLLGLLFAIIPGLIVWILCAFDAMGQAAKENRENVRM